MRIIYPLLIVIISISCTIKHQHSDIIYDQSVSLQKIEVITENLSSIHGKMLLYERNNREDEWQFVLSFPVVVGKNGLAYDSLQIDPLTGVKIKHEGDGCSPAGAFSLGKIFSYHQLENLKMPFEQVDENDLCVDDINSIYYNTLIDDDTIALKDYKSFERMQRKDFQYEYGVWVNYNTDPQIAGSGSCIFLHIWKNENNGTSGCTAMSKENMLKLIEWLDAGKQPLLIQTAE